MKIALCYNSKMENTHTILEKLKTALTERNVSFETLEMDNLKSDYDIALVIGGDGTILRAARFYSEFEIPVFGINLGRLGFLSQSGQNEIGNTISRLLSGNYIVERRLMLKANGYNALNDFVIKGASSGRISRFALEINEKFVCEYYADGIIISTPTGSTAYGMAAGGPILAPNLEIIEIVPICAHTFSARPIVVSGNDKIKIIPCENCEYNVYADGQIVFPMKGELIVSKSEKNACLGLLPSNDFYSILRNKLQWGISPAKG